MVLNNRLTDGIKLYDHRLKSFLSHNVSCLKPQWNAKEIKTLNRNTKMHSRVFPSRSLLPSASAAKRIKNYFLCCLKMFMLKHQTQCEPGELKQYHFQSISSSQSKILCYSRLRSAFKRTSEFLLCLSRIYLLMPQNDDTLFWDSNCEL